MHSVVWLDTNMHIEPKGLTQSQNNNNSYYGHCAMLCISEFTHWYVL